MSTNNETKWLVRALVTLAKRHLADANATPEVQAGEWPAGQEWNELGNTSQHSFMRRAREEAGIPHEEYRALIEAATMESGDLDAIWRELERPNVQAQPDAQALLRGSAGAPGSASVPTEK